MLSNWVLHNTHVLSWRQERLDLQQDVVLHGVLNPVLGVLCTVYSRTWPLSDTCVTASYSISASVQLSLQLTASTMAW